MALVYILSRAVREDVNGEAAVAFLTASFPTVSLDPSGAGVLASLVAANIMEAAGRVWGGRGHGLSVFASWVRFGCG